MNLVEMYYEPIVNHRRWYDRFNKLDHLARWEQLLVAQPEAAIVEAQFRDVLEKHVDVVYPNESLSTGGPDFKCFVKTGATQHHFYVECCCLTIAAVEAATGLPRRLTSPGVNFAPLTAKFRAEAKGKASQMSGLDAPGIVALGTLHMPSEVCFSGHFANSILTSETMITQVINPTTGEPVGGRYLSSDMRKAAFQYIDRNNPDELIDASRSISALLLCNFGHAAPYKMHGVLHPNPVRPLDIRLLPKIVFSTLKELGGGKMQTEYTWTERD